MRRDVMKRETKTEILLYTNMGLKPEEVSEELDIPISHVEAVIREKEPESTKEEKLQELLKDNATTQNNITHMEEETKEQIKSKYLTYTYLLRELTVLSTVGYEDGTPFVKPTANHDVKTLQKATRILESLKELEWALNDIKETEEEETKEVSLEDYVESIDDDED